MLFPTDAAPIQLTEKYRPRCLEQLRGQQEAQAALSSFVGAPFSTAFLFEGDTGTGKTSAALALAHDLGCAVEYRELGGLHEIASGEQTGESVRNVLRSLWLRPFYGKGWRVLIVNECDHMTKQAEAIWLDALERLPAYCVVIFTTNNADDLPARFRDRCERLKFRSDVESTKAAAQQLARDIWRAETGRNDPPPITAADVIADGRVSFRRVVQALTRHVRAASVPAMAVA